jgi:hypothetical protein
MPHRSVQRQDCHGEYSRQSTFPARAHRFLQLDAGQHPAYDGLAAQPFFDEFDLSTVDVLLITQ